MDPPEQFIHLCWGLYIRVSDSAIANSSRKNPPKYGGHFSEKKKRLRQRTQKLRACKNMGAIFLKKKSACGNVPRSSGLVKKILLTPFGPIWAHDPIWAHLGPSGPIFPWWAHGPLLLSTRGGAIGIMYFIPGCHGKQSSRDSRDSHLASPLDNKSELRGQRTQSKQWSLFRIEFRVNKKDHSANKQAGTPRHGTERRTRRFMARHGTENHGTEKYWHGPARKILARENNGTAWPGKIS